MVNYTAINTAPIVALFCAGIAFVSKDDFVLLSEGDAILLRRTIFLFKYFPSVALLLLLSLVNLRKR